MTETILQVRDLAVTFSTPDGPVAAVRSISFDVAKGETLAIVGESGSGKSQTMMAVMGLLASNGKATGSARYRGQEMIGLSPARLNTIRGKSVTMIFQEPMTSLDPLYRIGRQMAEPLMHHGGLSRAQARARAIELLELVRIDDPERRIDAFPHQLSGGQRQRVMIAMALANNPDLLIADEPTTALDVTIQAQILELLAELKERIGLAILFITHDLGIVRRFADRVLVMRSGEVVESGDVAAIFDAPSHPYTQMLLAAEPEGTKAPVDKAAPIILQASNVAVGFRIGGGFLKGSARILQAVDHVSLTIRKGQTIGVVGESGSGKSTLGRALLKLNHGTGRVIFAGTDLAQASPETLRGLRRQMQLVFQDPFGSLSPRMTAGQIITEGLLVHAPEMSRAERDKAAGAALTEVGLDPAMRNRYPHEFSGGQRQRLAIARAIILKPDLVVLDEPTSALDRSVQKQIVDLLRDLQARYGLSYLFISHDLKVVRALSDHIMVMKGGKVVEEGPAADVFANPAADYTKALMAAAFFE